ncbi:MAG: GNAT family N-acetyltransferase [Candidatus Hodarchaeales archaeon]
MSGLRFKFFYKDVFNWREAEFLRASRSHPLVVKHLFESRHITKGQQEDWFERCYKSNINHRIWIAYDEEVSAPIGYVQYHIDSVIHKRCEVGYVIHPLYFNKGFGNALVDWSIRNVTTFEEEIHKVWLTVFTNNKVAIKIYQKNDFKIEGTCKDYVYKDGVYRDIFIMSLIL